MTQIFNAFIIFFMYQQFFEFNFIRKSKRVIY